MMMLEPSSSRKKSLRCHTRPLVETSGKKVTSQLFLRFLFLLMFMLTPTSLLAYRPVYHDANPQAVHRSSFDATKRQTKRYQQRLNSKRLLMMGGKDKDWDKLLDDNDNDNDNENGPPVAPDMRYIPRIVQRQNQNFLAIQQAGGKEVVNDVYVRDPSSQVFWFVGKVARISDVTLAQCIARQWNLIETHASNLRPLELFPARGSLEIWTAPGDSELDVAYNRPDIVFQKHSWDVEGSQSVKNNLIGFQGEVYGRGEQGFRTWRLEDGRPARPEVQVQGPPSVSDATSGSVDASTRAPTDEEMEQIRKALEGKDINALYEEQQRRAGKEL